MSKNSLTQSRDTRSPAGSNGWWIVAILLFSLILGGSEITIFGRRPIVSPSDLLLLGILLFSIYRSVLGGFRLDFSDKTILYLSLAFMLAQLTSFLFNLLDVPRGFLAVKVFGFGYLSYLYCVTVLKKLSDVQKILGAVVLWGAALSLYLIYFYITDWSSIIATQASNETKTEIGIAIGKSNYLAALLVPVFPTAISAIFAARRYFRVGAAICAVLIFVGLLITMSKGALLSLAVGSLLAIPLVWKSGVRLRPIVLVVGAVAGLLLLGLAVEPDLLDATYDLFSMRVDNPDFARLDLWAVAWRIFVSHPFLGVGPNAIYLFNEQFAINDLYTHNFILNTLSDLGLAGAIPFFSLLGVLLWRSYRFVLAAMADFRLRPIALGLFIGFVSTLLHGMVEPTFPGQQYAIIFWILMAIIYQGRSTIPPGADIGVSSPTNTQISACLPLSITGVGDAQETGR